MKTQELRFRNEEGSVMVIAFLMLVFLTLIGIAATTSTEIENRFPEMRNFIRWPSTTRIAGSTPLRNSFLFVWIMGAQPAVSGISYLKPMENRCRRRHAR